MNKKLWALSLGIAGMIAAIGCQKQNAEDLYTVPDPATCDTVNVSFSQVIKPIIDASCATSGCHLGASATGWDLSDYTGVFSANYHSVLMPAINHTGPSPMPKGGAKLDDCTIAKIQAWVNKGAPND